jgi:hypothetical protein
MSSVPPAPAKGNSQFSWLLVMAMAPLLLVAAFFLQREVPPEPVESETPSLSEAQTASEPSQIPVRPVEPNGKIEKITEETETVPDEEEREGVNASIAYRKAFTIYAGLTDEDKALLRRPAPELPAAKAAALFKKIQPIMELLRGAQDADYCEWGTGNLAYGRPLPHLARALDLGTVAVWSADYRFASNPEEAFVDLQAQAGLGDNLADTIAGWHTQMTMESLAGNMVRQHTAQLTADSADSAVDFASSTSITDNLRRAIESEVDSIEALAEKLQAQPPEERSRSLELLRARFQPAGGKIDAKLEAKMLEESWLTEELQLIRDLAGQIGEEMLSSPKEYESWWEYAQQRFFKNHPLAALVLPSFGSLRGPVDRYLVERSMLYSGFSIIRDEEEDSRNYNDPYTDTPYAYVKKGTGFELRSHFTEGGKPLVMTFLRPKPFAETSEGTEPEP